MGRYAQAPWNDDTAPLISAGDKRVLLRGKTPLVAIRVLSEENFQFAKRCVNLVHKVVIEAAGGE